MFLDVHQIFSVVSSEGVMGLYFSAPLWLGGCMCLMKLYFWARTFHRPVRFLLRKKWQQQQHHLSSS